MEKWKFFIDEASNGFVDIISEDGDTIATCYGWFEKTKPNSKLIACVPETLEMLEDVLSYLDSGQKAEAEEMLFHKIKELIKKATD